MAITCAPAGALRNYLFRFHDKIHSRWTHILDDHKYRRDRCPGHSDFIAALHQKVDWASRHSSRSTGSNSIVLKSKPKIPPFAENDCRQRRARQKISWSSSPQSSSRRKKPQSQKTQFQLSTGTNHTVPQISHDFKPVPKSTKQFQQNS